MLRMSDSLARIATAFAAWLGMLTGLIEIYNTQFEEIKLTAKELVAISLFCATVAILWDWHRIRQIAISIVSGDQPLHLIDNWNELADQLYKLDDSVVRGSQKSLIITGSRSRDKSYLDQIYEHVRDTPRVEHIRILFGAPQTTEIVDHLARLEELTATFKTIASARSRIKVAMIPIPNTTWERFICISEKKCVIIIPSINDIDGFDTAIVTTDPVLVARYNAQLRNLASRKD